jgi:hypothetical protein
MLLDAISIYYVFVPIFFPLMTQFGWDPVWFGVMMTVNLAIGTITPPVAVNLYVASRIAETSMEEISRWVLPFFVALLAALVLVVPLAVALYYLILMGGMSPIVIAVERLGVLAAIRRGLVVARASIRMLMATNLLLLATLLPAFVVFGLAVTGLEAITLDVTALAVITILLQSALTAVSTLLFISLWLSVYRTQATAPSATAS